MIYIGALLLLTAASIAALMIAGTLLAIIRTPLF